MVAFTMISGVALLLLMEYPVAFWLLFVPIVTIAVVLWLLWLYF